MDQQYQLKIDLFFVYSLAVVDNTVQKTFGDLSAREGEL